MSARKTEPYTCRVCGKSQYTKPVAVLEEKYSVLRCGYCTFESLDPLPSDRELDEFYTNYPFTQLRNRDKLKNDEIRKLHAKIIDFLISHSDTKENSKFLDYGFGKAHFLQALAERGIAASGVECSDADCRRLKEYCENKGLNIEVASGGAASLKQLTKKPFDCITLFSTLEHVPDPVNLISELSKIHKPGGVLYIECPNNDALYLKVKNLIRKRLERENFFNALKSVEHLSGFNRRSVTALLKRTGYFPVEVRDFRAGDGVHQVENIYWYPSLYSILFKKGYRNLYSALQCFHKILDIPAHMLFGKGSGLYALARKL